MRGMWNRFVAFLLAIGEYAEEMPAQRAKRRIFVVTLAIATGLTILFIPPIVAEGHTWEAVNTGAVAAAAFPVLTLLYAQPRWFGPLVTVMFTVVSLSQIVSMWLFGGLVEEGLGVIYGLIVALAALIVFSRRAALIWFGVFVAQVVFGIVVAENVEPRYVDEQLSLNTGLNVIAFGVVIIAVVLYFVRQRDRFQRESDDLLHNILPDEIAARLKTDRSMIADNFREASVLFADVVGFTPLSATMSPPELVGLLNSVFSTFDEFVEDLGLEKIKTVGDEYMVAAGVPLPRHDHAVVIAQLALQIRDHVAVNDFHGHRLNLRIGINSGPVVAGIIGTHKFSYDMWGDTVNMASRMESEGLAGAIQVSAATYRLLADGGFRFRPRGTVEIKGKGPMETWLLLDRP